MRQIQININFIFKLKYLISAIIILLISIASSYSKYDLYYNQSPQRENLIKHTQKLGSDDFMGRGTGYKGGYLASEYLSNQFENIGLKKAKGLEKYFQNIPFHEKITQENSVLEFFTKSDTIKPSLNFDYLVHKSGTETLIPKPINMVFVGYGIIAPEYDYNDYRNIDVLNKVVVMFSGEPDSEDDSYFYGKISSKHSQIDIKQRMAISQGARACIIIPNPDEYSFEEWAKMVYQYSFSELSLAYSPSEILTIQINPQLAESIFENEKYDFEQLCKFYANNKLISFEMETNIMFRGSYKDRIFTAPNVIGYLEGSDKDLKNTCVIVSAHYDHLGIGLPVNGDSIYNGVLDNSMGVAALLEIARIMSESDAKPKRSVVFLLTTAEEKGLLGSLHYLNNPLFPLYKTVANINIDGVAFIDNFKSVVGIGSKLSDLGKYLSEIAHKMDIEIEEFPTEFKEIESFNRSDQIAFASVGIPAMMVMDGTNYVNIDRDYGILKLNQYMSSIYHSPFDDLDILINWDAATQHTHILLNLIASLANSDYEPKWENWTQYYYEKIKITNEKR